MSNTKLLTAASVGLCLAVGGLAATATQSSGQRQVPPQQPSSGAKAAESAPPAQQLQPKVTAAPDFRHQFVDVAKIIRPSVVTVTSVSTVKEGAGSPFEGSPFEFFFRGGPRPEGKQHRQGMGSGVIVDARGYILTNNHVVADADEIKVVLSNDHELTAELVGADPKTDVAVIKVKLDDRTKAEGLHAATIGDSDRLEVGEWVIAVGAPFGLTQTVSAGIVSAVGRGNVGIADYEDFVQTDAAINPGNSGGPLVNLDGRIVGVNTAIASQTGGNNGVGFAIPINMAKAVMDQLIQHGEVVRGYLGVYIAGLSDELANSFKYQGSGGALVQDVAPDGPGAKAGLRAGDIIIERDGKPVKDVATFRNGISATAPGSSVNMTVWRDGKKQSVKAKLEALPNESKAEKVGERQQAPSGGRGLGLMDLTPELRQRLQLKDERGAVVSGVRPDSAAARGGLQPGDLITQVGSEDVKNAADAQRLIGRDKDKALRLRILREGRGLFVILPPAKND
jgi:serine protease Do